jgi:hypothetical protein
MTERQCSSCGGFCKRSGCERENVKRLADALETLSPLERDAAAELRRLTTTNAQLLEALQQIIDLPEDSRIHYKVARRAIAAAKEKS